MNQKFSSAAIAIICLAVLILELTLTRLFSATMYYHFAFMAISMALFGTGASGVFVFLLLSKVKERHTSTWVCASCLMFAVSTVFALWAILTQELSLEIGLQNFYRLTVVYGAASLPFFFAGCAVTLTITRLPQHISRLYLFDLAGAAAGCLLFIPVLNSFGGINAVLMVAVLGCFAALIFALTPGGTSVPVVVSCVAIVGFSSLFAYNFSTDAIEISSAKGLKEENVLYSKWNSLSRITVAGKLDHGEVLIRIDSDAATLMTKDARPELHESLRGRIESLAYNLKTNGHVLIIGPGGGQDVMAALLFGQKKITGVEVNPIIARDVMGSEPFLSYSGHLYQQPGVRIVVDEGRSFIRNSESKYDLIQATMVDTWAATSAGAFALTENHLYTVEAFKDYANHLNSDGLLTMTRWYFEPPDQLLRLLSLVRAMMTELDISNPERHVMLVRDARGGEDPSPATFLFKLSPFTDDEIDKIERIAQTVHYDLLYSPRTRPDNIFTKMMTAKDPAAVWHAFPTNVDPPRDNNPFFFNSLRLSNISSVFSGSTEWRKTNMGTVILFASFVLATILVMLFMIVPLAAKGGRDLLEGTSNGFSYLMYFACLGGGFIIVEVAMIQRFILFLGHPVYALAVVLFSLLIFSAAGSYLTGRISSLTLFQSLRKILILLVALGLCYVLVLPPIFYGLVHLDRVFRIALSVVLLAPLALLMGMPMPIGLKLVSQRAPSMIPWAWGINGATSVTGSVAALVIAVLSGFDQALLVGFTLYILGLICIMRAEKPSTQSKITSERVHI